MFDERAARDSRVAPRASALTVSSATIFVRLSEPGPSATAFHRLFLALPLPWRHLEERRPPRPQSTSTRKTALPPRDMALLVLAGLALVSRASRAVPAQRREPAP